MARLFHCLGSILVILCHVLVVPWYTASGRQLVTTSALLEACNSGPAGCWSVAPVTDEAPALQVVQSLGFAIYRALDWGLDESEERELSPQLERLIDLMANNDCDDSGCGVADEGYGGPEEEEEAEGGPRAVRTFAQAMRLCAARLTDPRGAQAHYQAVCRALFVETLELRAFLARVREAKEVRRGTGRSSEGGGVLTVGHGRRWGEAKAVPSWGVPRSAGHGPLCSRSVGGSLLVQQERKSAAQGLNSSLPSVPALSYVPLYVLIQPSHLLTSFARGELRLTDAKKLALGLVASDPLLLPLSYFLTSLSPTCTSAEGVVPPASTNLSRCCFLLKIGG